MSDSQNHTPNQVALFSRLLRTAGAIVLVANGVIGIVRDDVIIPTKRSALHLHGLSGWVTTGAMFCGALVLLAVVVDHYDRRHNEVAYKQFGRWMSRVGWMLMGLGIALQSAGIRYPAPSSITTAGLFGALFILLFATAIGFANEKAVERAAAAPKPASAPAPAPSAGRVPKLGLDRLFAGLLLMVVGALVFLAVLPGLVKFLVIQYAIAAVAVFLMVAGWLVFSGRKANQAKGDLANEPKPGNWRPIRIGVLLIVGLAAIWYTKASQWGQWKDQDEVERQTAPAWNYPLDEFAADVTRDDVQKTLSAAGFRMRCYDNLGPNERMNPDDETACWSIANNVFGIPSRMINFTFGRDGLHNIRLDFPKEQRKAVEKWFEMQGVLVEGGFGRDQGGAKIFGRRGPTGLVMVSDPGMTGWLMVIFQPRDYFIKNTCLVRDERDVHWQLLCRDWAASQKPSSFVQRSRPPAPMPPETMPNANIAPQGQS